MVEEMIKFRTALDQRGIKWFDASDGWEEIGCRIDRTHFFYANAKWSVVNGLGTYGGQRLFNQANEGLLEVWGTAMDEPEGYLTADDAINLIFKGET